MTTNTKTPDIGEPVPASFDKWNRVVDVVWMPTFKDPEQLRHAQAEAQRLLDDDPKRDGPEGLGAEPGTALVIPDVPVQSPEVPLEFKGVDAAEGTDAVVPVLDVHPEVRGL